MLGLSTGVVSEVGPGSRLVGGRRLLACLAAALVATMVAAGSARAVLVSATNGRLASFSGGISQVNGTLLPVRSRYLADTRAFLATYSGTGGGGMARGSLKVRWKQGQSVAYGAAFYLPLNFHSAAGGQQPLLRWDSVPRGDGTVEQSGIVVDYSDNLAYLVAATVSDGIVSQQVLAGPFALPVGRWFTLQVRQLLGSDRGRIATST